MRNLHIVQQLVSQNVRCVCAQYAINTNFKCQQQTVFIGVSNTEDPEKCRNCSRRTDHKISLSSNLFSLTYSHLDISSIFQGSEMDFNRNYIKTQSSDENTTCQKLNTPKRVDHRQILSTRPGISVRLSIS